MTDLRSELHESLSDRYTILREIGAGGMATVFLARDLKHKRVVALKVLRAEIGEAIGRERFLREVDVTARLQHPHVLPVFDSGESGHYLWYTMPYVEGETLRARMTRVGRLPLDDALRIAHDIGSALSYAHERGVVHRDVKPENVLVTLQGAALLADFGIATASDISDPRLTATGMGLGTPKYMAPEQMMGERPIRPQADVYAMGVVLHEMLAGRRPFDDAAQFAMLARQFTEGAPSITDTRPDVPPAMAKLVQRSLEVDPGLRPEDATRFLALLEEAVTGARALPRASAAAPTSRRRSTALLAVAGAILAAFATFVWSRERVATGETSIAVLPFANRTGDTTQTFLSDGLAEDLTASLARVSELRVVPNSSVRRFRGSDLTPEAIAAELAVTHVLTGALSRRGDSVRVSIELVNAVEGRQQWSDARTVPQRELAMVVDSMARALRHTLLPRGTLTRLAEGHVTRDSLAYNYYLLAQFHYNRFNPSELARSMAYYDSVLARDSAFVGAWLGRAGVLMAMASGNGRINGREALGPLREAVDRALALDPRSASAYALRGHAYTWFEWDWDAAGREFAKAVSLAPRDPAILQRASFLQVAEGNTDSALALIRGLRAAEPTNLRGITSSASATFFGRRFAECLDWAERSLELEPSYQPGMQFRALCLSGLARHEDAVTAARAAVSTAPTPLLLSTMAIVLARADSTAAARAAIAQLESLADAPSFDAGLLFRPYAALNERDRFFEVLERAIADRSYQVSVLTVDPVLDPVRSDPRFVPMLTRAGLKVRAR